MSYSIEWPDRAKRDRRVLLFNIWDWTHDQKRALDFVERLIKKTEAALSSGIATYRKGKIKGTHEYVVHENYVVIYREYTQLRRIEILALWDVRQNPNRLSLQ